MTVSELLAVLDSDEISIYNADRTAMFERGAALDHEVIKVEPVMHEEYDYGIDDEAYLCDCYVSFDILID